MLLASCLARFLKTTSEALNTYFAVSVESWWLPKAVRTFSRSFSGEKREEELVFTLLPLWKDDNRCGKTHRAQVGFQPKVIYPSIQVGQWKYCDMTINCHTKKVHDWNCNKVCTLIYMMLWCWTVKRSKQNESQKYAGNNFCIFPDVSTLHDINLMWQRHSCHTLSPCESQ